MGVPVPPAQSANYNSGTTVTITVFSGALTLLSTTIATNPLASFDTNFDVVSDSLITRITVAPPGFELNHFDNFSYGVSPSAAAVSEPAVWLLATTAFAGLGVAMRPRCAAMAG